MGRDCGGWGRANESAVRGRGEWPQGSRAAQICSPLKAPRAAVEAAVEAALAAAVCTVLLDMTPVANSCWAFSKLAPVVRYSPCT